NGPGIPPEHLGRVFDPFFTTKEVGQGTGLGLSICYGIVKEHRGTIAARNAPSGGAVFSVELPVTRPPHAAHPAPHAVPAPADPATRQTGRSVLVVDDEASIRDLLAKTLALAEYDVDVAPDGRSALERMRMYPYDLLIADLKMPGMDGLTVIREAKRYKADLPVIIITGFSTESSAIEAVNLGVAGYLTKPFRVPQVLAAAAKALGE
ncbi:MAG: response regulator, partial [bacterium]